MTGNGGTNGTYHCPVSQDWEEFRDEFKEARKQCKELNTVMELILKNTGYLVKLPELTENVESLSVVMKDMKDNLLAPATGRDQIPTETVNMMFAAQNRNSRYNMWVLCFVITALMLILGSLLIGERYKVIAPLYRPGLPSMEDTPSVPKSNIGNVMYRSC